MAIAPGIDLREGEQLNRFPVEEVAPIANALVGTIKSNVSSSESFCWLHYHPQLIDFNSLYKRLQKWQSMTFMQVAKLFFLLHKFALNEILMEIAKMHSSVDTTFDSSYTCMGQIALFGLANRDFNESSIE